MSAPILSIRHLTFGYYPGQPVLQDVHFSLQPSRVVVVLGANGAGKTTLLSLLLGWLTAWSGEIALQGTPLPQLSARERGRCMALVPQSEHTPFDYTALEYVLMGRAPHLPPLGMPSASDIEMAQQALAQVGIAPLAGRPVPQLSGGERQLMLLARALTQISPTNGEAPDNAPRLLLLDEPTAHLDLHNKARLIAIMRRLRDAGVTLLMTNHEPDVALAVADDVLLMAAGATPQFGAAEQVITADALSRLYQLPIRLIEVDGRKRVLWT